MTTLLLVLHILICLALIGIVLVQGGGKGAEMGASFGAGGSQTVFGAAGGQNFMSKLTTGVAVIFMLTSLCLTYYFSQPGASSIMPSSMTTAVPAEAPPVAAEPAPANDAQPAAPAAEKSEQ